MNWLWRPHIQSSGRQKYDENITASQYLNNDSEKGITVVGGSTDKRITILIDPTRHVTDPQIITNPWFV